ncbi:hypothetical protein K501DRAFT_212306 [Backusella circina FSU 941]|nr:hypothetical protein K501DRAFT_212306 [Backusella circina FSU 941]
MSYISQLNLLNADSPVPINEDAFAEELALWANAQFSFDTAPGSAIVDEENKDAKLLEALTQLVQQPPNNNTSTVQQETNNNVMASYYQHVAPQQPKQQPMILPRIAPAPGPINNNPMLDITKTNNKRKAPEEDAEVLTAEDDKRRRNTAASARFRMKKKLREQALEQKSKEMATQVDKLESRVKELEMEAKWLRALVIEKDPKLLTNDA